MSKNAKDAKTIAEKRTELEQLLAWFESDEFVVEQAVEKFETAENLASEIEAELLKQKNTIQVLKQRFNGEAD